MEKEQEATNLANIQKLVEPCLQNKDIAKAREILYHELRKAETGMTLKGEFRDLFLKYPPENEICPLCNQKTVEHEFDKYALRWEVTLCRPCKLPKYKQQMDKDINEIMAKVVPRRYVGAKITDFPASYKDLHKKTGSLFLHGSRGTGKTHLMAALAREIILKAPPLCEFNQFYRDFNYTPLFASIPELLMQIRSSYKRNDLSEEELLDRYSKSDILMLDDLGAEKPTEWVLQTLYLIIDRRYRDMKRTIISSNYTLDQIAKRLDDRISSRIAGMCEVIQIKGKDRRLPCK